jgi:4-amino-4-deoxy-L-arabinose transferase-like glycosyltransferase
MADLEVSHGPPSGRRIHAIAASALLLVYLAVMSGHMSSMDGFLIQRQARALAIEHSINFQTPGWFWEGKPVYASKFGIGMSLAYVPGMMFASPLASLVPETQTPPRKAFAYYFEQLYQDPLYAVGASWVHAVITALAAYLVARLMTALGSSRVASIWGMVLYGLGSSALIYSRGDFTHPLVGLCWLAALLGAVRFRQTGSTPAIWICSAAVGYAILTRPLDGMLLIFAVLALVVPLAPSAWNLRTLRPAFVVMVGVVVSVALTALINWARHGDPLTTGYKLENGWVVPDLERIAYVLAGPARGVLWEFPAVLLLPFGVAALRQREKRFETIVLLSLCGALLLNTAMWKMWWGGWCWGLRLFLPAIPVLAVVAGAGIDRLGPRMRRVLPAALLLTGFACAVPGVITDPIAGFAKYTD